jgi:CheY-like chemotaxis protein
MARALLTHELKTSIAVIAGYAELLATMDDEDRRIAAATQILAATDRLSAGVDAMLGDAQPMPPAHVTNGAAVMPPPGLARIVVADDDVFVRRLLRATLSTEEFELAEASDGQTALSVIEVHRPDLVLLDWQMPNVSGEGVLAELKRRYAHLPVVVLTASGEHRDRARELGADAFLTKPFSPLELLRTVEQLVAARPAA